MRMILTIFQKKICLGQMDHFGVKNGASSEVWIRCKKCCKFCTMKRANRWIKVIMVCTKKHLFVRNGPFWAQKWRILWICPKSFKILQNKRDQLVHENFILRKKLFFEKKIHLDTVFLAVKFLRSRSCQK